MCLYFAALHPYLHHHNLLLQLNLCLHRSHIYYLHLAAHILINHHLDLHYWHLHHHLHLIPCILYLTAPVFLTLTASQYQTQPILIQIITVPIVVIVVILIILVVLVTFLNHGFYPFSIYLCCRKLAK